MSFTLSIVPVIAIDPKKLIPWVLCASQSGLIVLTLEGQLWDYVPNKLPQRLLTDHTVSTIIPSGYDRRNLYYYVATTDGSFLWDTQELTSVPSSGQYFPLKDNPGFVRILPDSFSIYTPYRQSANYDTNIDDWAYSLTGACILTTSRASVVCVAQGKVSFNPTENDLTRSNVTFSIQRKQGKYVLTCHRNNQVQDYALDIDVLWYVNVLGALYVCTPTGIHHVALCEPHQQSLMTI